MTRKRFVKVCCAARLKESVIKALVKAIQDHGYSYAKVLSSLKPIVTETCVFCNTPAPKEFRHYVIGYDAGCKIYELTYMEVEEKDG